MSKISKIDGFRRRIGRSVSDVDNMIDSDSLSNPTLSPRAAFEKAKDEALEWLYTAIRKANVLIQQYILEMPWFGGSTPWDDEISTKVEQAPTSGTDAVNQGIN